MDNTPCSSHSDALYSATLLLHSRAVGNRFMAEDMSTTTDTFCFASHAASVARCATSDRWTYTQSTTTVSK